VAMIEMSSSTRKKVKHNGVIKSQSFRPETHCVSLLGCAFVASEVAFCASATTDLLSIFVS
jgi:hypothetical protein